MRTIRNICQEYLRPYPSAIHACTLVYLSDMTASVTVIENNVLCCACRDMCYYIITVSYCTYLFMYDEYEGIRRFTEIQFDLKRIIID